MGTGTATVRDHLRWEMRYGLTERFTADDARILPPDRSGETGNLFDKEES